MLKLTVTLSLLLGLVRTGLCTEQWVCQNDYEAHCSTEGCAIYQGDDFTSASVLLSSEGELEICLYSGCWQGQSEVLADSPYLVLQGKHLQWNNPYTSNQQQALLSLERATNLATLQVAGFQLALLCKLR